MRKQYPGREAGNSRASRHTRSAWGAAAQQPQVSPRNRTWLWVAIVLLAVGVPVCACVALPLLVRNYQAANKPVVLQVAYSPEKEDLFTELVRDFQATHPRLPDGHPIEIRATKSDPDAMIDGALAGQYQAITPDSSIWLTQLDIARQQQQGGEITTLGQGASMVGEVTRYAVSPVVVAMWEDTARSIGYPAKSMSWGDLLSKARSDPNFKWSHPSTSSAAGLLATLAEFYAGSGKTRGLTKDDATAKGTLDYVGALEKTVRYYGEGELALIDQMAQQGPSYLDAVVAQEQLVIRFNQQGKGKGKLVAIYPTEGSLWEDHPLALLEQPDLTADQRLAFTALSNYLLSPEAQQRILRAGYRPVDLNIRLDSPDSPIKAANGVDPLQPKTVLQIPGGGVLQVVRDVWWYTKRHTNVYLVADVSGSMDGQKLDDAKAALHTFLGQIRGDQERVGLISFASDINEVVPLGLLQDNRGAMEQGIDSLVADGNTSLVDAVDRAYTELQTLNDRERINAIVVMTDGKENNSYLALDELVAKIRAGNQQGPPVVIFCIAYGKDADMGTLQAIAEVTNGQARRGDPETIRQLYKLLSAYF